MHVFRSLIDERGPWSANPFPNCAVRHWKLDKTEDAWRRRPKLRQNYHFDEKLCYPSSSALEKEATVLSCENKSGIPIPEQMKRFLLKGIRRITEEVNPEADESDNESSSSKGMTSEEVPDGQSSELLKDGEQKDAIQERKDSSSPAFETDSGQVNGELKNYDIILKSHAVFSSVCNGVAGSCHCTLHHGYSKEKVSWTIGSLKKCPTFLC